MEVNCTNILLSINRGMLGCITPNLRAVKVNWGNNYIFLYFFYHETPSEDEQDLAEQIASSVVSDFPDVALQSFEVKKIVLPYPQILPQNELMSVYLRYEPYEELD